MKRPLCAGSLLLAAVLAAYAFFTLPGSVSGSVQSPLGAASESSSEEMWRTSDAVSERAGVREVQGVPAAMQNAVIRRERVRLSGQVYQCRSDEDQTVLWLKKIAVSGLENETVRFEIPLKEMCICYCERTSVPEIGSVVCVEGTPDVFSAARNPGEFDSARYYWTQRIAFRIKNARLTAASKSHTPIRAALFRVQQYARELILQYVPEREAGVLCAMLLGDKTFLDEEVRSLYSQSGIAHVLAISGLHISMLGALLYRALRRMGLPLRVSMAVCCAFLAGYSVMTGMSASTLRAAVMFVLGLNAERVRRTYDMKTALAVSMALQLLKNPRLAVTAGFQLSYGAAAGIAWLTPALTNLWADMFSRKKSRPPKPVRAILSCLGVSMATLPILLIHQYEYAVYGLMFNLFVLPSVSVLLPAGFLLIVSAMAADGCVRGGQLLAVAGDFMGNTVGGMMAAAAEGILQFAGLLMKTTAHAAAGCCRLLLFFYKQGSRFVSSLPGSLLRGRPHNIRIALYAAMLLGLIVWVEMRRRKKKGGVRLESRGTKKIRRRSGGGEKTRIKGLAESREKAKAGELTESGERAKAGELTESRERAKAGGLTESRERAERARVQRGGKIPDLRENEGSRKKTDDCRFLLHGLLGMGWLALALLVLLVPVGRGLTITILDVGQGDGICIEQNPGHAILVDCGSSDQRGLFEKRLLPFLKYRGIYELDAVFLSHLDSDHVSAVYDLLKTMDTEHIRVSRIVVGQEIPRDEAYEKLLAAAGEARVPVYLMRVGEVYAEGVCRFTCLGPSAEIGRTGDRNAASLILRLDYGEFQALFTGDATAQAELAAARTMAERMPQETIELLKAAHHGSRYSTSEEFLQVVDPRIAVLSAGAGNSYGHPHAETLARLDGQGCDSYRTPESGAVTIHVSRKGMRVEVFLDVS